MANERTERDERGSTPAAQPTKKQSKLVAIKEWQSGIGESTASENACFFDGFDAGWEARGVSATGETAQAPARTEARRQQTERVMPLIGPLLDAWEQVDLSTKSDLCDQYKTLHDALQNIYKAMES